jgi:hypothetical protein
MDITVAFVLKLQIRKLFQYDFVPKQSFHDNIANVLINLISVFPRSSKTETASFSFHLVHTTLKIYYFTWTLFNNLKIIVLITI